MKRAQSEASGKAPRQRKGLAGVLEALRGFRRVLVTGHVRPDGDSVGSSVALVLILKAMGIEASLSVVPENVGAPRFLLEGVPNILPADLPAAPAFDAVAALDSSADYRVPEHIQPFLKALPVVNIDHHNTNPGFGMAIWLQPDASSTGELIYRLARRAKVPLTRAIAEALWVAVITDTGRFAYDSTHPATMRMGAHLLEAGVRSAEINDKIYVFTSQNALNLKGRAYKSLETWFDGRVSIVSLTAADFRETGCSKSDVEDVVDIPRSVESSLVNLFFYESNSQPGVTRMSIRTRGSFDAIRLATRFGGGGHFRAAGCDVPGDLASAKKTVKQTLAEWFPAAPQ